MLEIVDWDHPDAVRLRAAQQAELKDLYGEDDIGHAMTGETILAMVLLRVDGDAVACGAIRDASDEDGLGPDVGELKRMFVLPAARGRGYSRVVLTELERLARGRGLRRLVLETGVLQVQAIGLYLSAGYHSMDNFGEYATETSSRCFTKDLHQQPRERRTAPRPPIELARVPWEHPDATALRKEMFADGAVRYPEFPAPESYERYDAETGVGMLSTVVARIDGHAVGCASLRATGDGFPAGSGELKKVWVADEARGTGVARALLAAIEDDARAHGLTSVVLQTGIRQPEAVTLYRTAGYRPAPPFAPYADDFLSLCFAKDV
ncbi:GNAT family N-acetyltransferase [Cellulomonas sp. ICMP 17802]|uniref:GNAT family N-acetyltransferase n=1 Tax=Cellulomonas sp. ICMP 17802 TaxID=3239199 RepID=UPI00351AF09A